MLSAYIDGEAQTSDAETIKTHLSECDSCASELRALQAMTGMLRTTPEAEPPAFLLAQIEAATVNRTGFLARVKRAFDHVPTTARWASAPIAAAVVLLGILLANNRAVQVPMVVNEPTQGVEQAAPGLPNAVVEEQLPAVPAAPGRPKTRATWSYHGKKVAPAPMVANQPKKGSAEEGNLVSRAEEPASTEEPKLEPPVIEEKDVASNTPAEPEARPTATTSDRAKPVEVVKASSEKPAKKPLALDEPGAIEQLRTKLAAKNKSKQSGHEDRIEGKKYSVGLISLRF
jgi:anti-sigma factor RsiW